MKRSAWICLILVGILMLSGCNNSSMTTLPDTDGESKTVLSSDGEKTDKENSASKAKKTLKPADTESISESESSEPAETENPPQTGKTDTGAVVTDKKPEEREETSSPSRKEKPKETTPPVTESKTGESGTKPPAPSETAKDESTTLPPAYQRPSASEVEAKVAEYLNQYRSTHAEVLSGLTNVARYRSQQLVSNFSHESEEDACTVLRYGEFVDMTQYGGKESDSYYLGYNGEAIAKGNWGGTAADIGKSIADGFRNSKSHWSYLSSDEYLYLAVGCTYDEKTSMWYCCVCVSRENYGG